MGSGLLDAGEMVMRIFVMECRQWQIYNYKEDHIHPWQTLQDETQNLLSKRD